MDRTKNAHRDRKTLNLRQLTTGSHGHMIANRGCWSADGASILYDLRDDETRFDGTAIERVMLDSLRVERIFESSNGACCGVPTCSPVDDRFVFIHADEHPDPQWSYCPWHRRGAVGRIMHPGRIETLDARDVVSPYTAGALRGGTHLHTFGADATAVLSTYEDHVLATSIDPLAAANRRGLAVTLLDKVVHVPQSHPRNHAGIGFTVCVTQLTDEPMPGSDEIWMATGEAWIGRRREIAFQGTVLDGAGQRCTELFLLQLPSDLRTPGDQPLTGTPRTRPGVPSGVVQQRLTWTTDRRFPGVVGPRHWAVSSPDGERIGFYMRDDGGDVQFWMISSSGGEPVQVTAGRMSPTSPFTWHPDGSKVTYVADGSVVWVHVEDGHIQRLTSPARAGAGPTHHACVFSPDASAIAFMQRVETGDGQFHQLHAVSGW